MKRNSSATFQSGLLVLFVCIISASLMQCTKTEPGIVQQSETDNLNITALANGTYKISPVINTSQAVALTTQTRDDSALVSAQLYNKDSLSHHWRIVKIATGTYRISCGYSGKVLATRSATANDGEQLIQVLYDSSKNEKWGITKNAVGQYRFVNKATGYYMNIENNGSITQRINSTAQNQLFNLSAVSAIYCDADINNFFRRTSGWIASDGAASAAFTDGRVLWMMGDSHINDYNATKQKVFCLFQVRNSCLLQPATKSWNWKAASTLTGNPLGGTQSYFKNKADDAFWIWPENGFQPAANDTMYVYTQSYKQKGVGAFGFVADSFPMWSKVLASTNKVVQYSYLQDFNDIDFGCGFVQEGDGYVYAFGARQTFIYANVYVARFPANNPNAAWTFWDGTAWNTDVTKAKRVSEGASNSVTVNKINGKYVCISTEFSVTCDAGTHLYSAWSNTPNGAFTTRKIFYQIPDRLQGHTPFFYAPNLHPEFTNTAGEVLITYDINGYGDCVNTCNSGYMDPDMYRPKGIRVPQAILTQ